MTLQLSFYDIYYFNKEVFDKFDNNIYNNW